MKNLKLFILTLIVFLTTLTIYFNSEKEDDEKIRIIMTGPSKERLADYIFLYKNRLFHDDRFVFTWIYPQDVNVTKVEKYLEKRRYDFIELKKIPCSVDQFSVFKENKCTPFFKDLFESSSAAVFNGGPDIPPQLYGQEPHEQTKPFNKQRNYFDISFLHHIFNNSENGKAGFIEDRKDYPLIGICLGMQQLNVALGGTLIQDIPSLVYKGREAGKNNIHRTMDKKKRAILNPVIIKDSLFKEDDVSGKELVFHNHHQAVEIPGKDLEATAFSEDGKIIEAVRHKIYPNAAGVQFHPEYRLTWKKYTTEENAQDFYKNFWKSFKKIIISNI